MTRKIFSRMMLEILLTRGVIHWLLGLTLVLLGHSGHLYATGTGLGLALAIFGRHSTYAKWKTFLISLLVFSVAFIIFSLFIQDGWFLSRAACFWLGLINLALAGLLVGIPKIRRLL